MSKKIRAMIGRGTRYTVNIDDLRQFNPKLSTFVLRHPIDGIKMFEDQLNTTIRGMQEDGGK